MQNAATALTAARKAGNAGKIAAAEAKARKETASLADARSATSTAGKRVAALIRSVGVRGRLTKAQSAATIKALLATLARRGVPTADVRAVAPAAPAPGGGRRPRCAVSLTRLAFASGRSGPYREHEEGGEQHEMQGGLLHGRPAGQHGERADDDRDRQ